MAVVKSVEKVTLTLCATTSVATNLTLGQDDTMCVPFYTHRADGGFAGDWREHLVDVYFDDNLGTARITAKRSRATTPGQKVIAYAVEFDPAEVNVQSASFSFTGSTTTFTITSVDTTKAFALVNARNTQGANNFDDVMPGADITAATSLQVRRASTFAALQGHYYVVEDQNSNFTVQKISSAPGLATQTQSFTISSVTLADSFLVCRPVPNEALDDMDRGCNWGYIASSTRVHVDRHFGGGDVTDFYAYVVTTQNGSWTTKRAQNTIAGLTNTQTTSISSVDVDRSIVIAGTNNDFPAPANASTTGSQRDNHMCTLDLETATTVGFKRLGGAGFWDGTYAFEVVEFALTGDEAAGIPIGTLQMMGIGR